MTIFYLGQPLVIRNIKSTTPMDSTNFEFCTCLLKIEHQMAEGTHRFCSRLANWSPCQQFCVTKKSKSCISSSLFRISSEPLQDVHLQLYKSLSLCQQFSFLVHILFSGIIKILLHQVSYKQHQLYFIYLCVDSVKLGMQSPAPRPESCIPSRQILLF